MTPATRRTLGSLLFNIFYFGLVASILLSLWVLLPFRAHAFRRGVRIWGTGTVWGLKTFVGIDHEIRGTGNLPDGPVIYAAKHQSAWDTSFFLVLNPDTAYVMKSELLKIPFWGWYMRKARHVAVDRKGGASALKLMIKGVQDILAEGRSVVVFPEGTRVAPGETGQYFGGVAAIATQSGVPVIPVAVNSGMFWGRRSFVKTPGTIVLEFLPAMPDDLDRRAFMTELQARIETATRKLEAEAAQAIDQAADQAADQAVDETPSG